MKLEVLELTEEDRAGLKKIVEKGHDWRMRHRAQTLLYFGDGWPAKAIATQQNLHLDTVYDRRKHWLAKGFTSLADKHRSGAPSPVGECHASTAQRGKRLNVVGALLSWGELFAAKLWETRTAMLFVGFLGWLMEHVGKPLVVILDNASVHKAKEIEPLLKVLQGKGLKLYFLPPYSPELNRIEKLWHKMKYE